MALWTSNDTINDPVVKVEVISSVIDEIAKKSYLSIDLTYLLGRYYLLEYWPFNTLNGKDRSYYAMKQYARSTGTENIFGSITFRDYYSLAFNQSSYYPLLIINSTSTTGNRGSALSIL